MYAGPLADDGTISFEEAAVQLPLEYEISIEPGDTEVESGTSLLVLARFGDAVPPDTTLVYSVNRSSNEDTNVAEESETRISMNKSLDDPI